MTHDPVLSPQQIAQLTVSAEREPFDGAGTDVRFWKLSQSLSALYPSSTDEKRWVDGVLARKKGLGL